MPSKDEFNVWCVTCQSLIAISWVLCTAITIGFASTFGFCQCSCHCLTVVSTISLLFTLTWVAGDFYDIYYECSSLHNHDSSNVNVDFKHILLAMSTFVPYYLATISLYICLLLRIGDLGKEYPHLSFFCTISATFGLFVCLILVRSLYLYIMFIKHWCQQKQVTN